MSSFSSIPFVNQPSGTSKFAFIDNDFLQENHKNGS